MRQFVSASRRHLPQRDPDSGKYVEVFDVTFSVQDGDDQVGDDLAVPIEEHMNPEDYSQSAFGLDQAELSPAAYDRIWLKINTVADRHLTDVGCHDEGLWQDDVAAGRVSRPLAQPFSSGRGLR